MNKIIQLNAQNIDNEHICCAFSDKKCQKSYQAKKDWLKQEFENGYVFRRLDARAKVFIEYGPAENAWIPIIAPNYININCFWVSGQYKGKGYGKELLQLAEADAIKQHKNGLVTVVGTKKFHFMSDTKWLQKQGFTECARLPYGFSILAKKLNANALNPIFNATVETGQCDEKNGLVAYYSNRCPFAEFHVENSLKETAQKRNIALKIVKLDTIQLAQNAPAPATIFSLFYYGKFLTTDLSICLDSRFDKGLEKYLEQRN